MSKRKAETETYVHPFKNRASRRNFIISRIENSVEQVEFFTHKESLIIEGKINEVVALAQLGVFKEHTVDKAQLRSKYFFGERYTYGKELKGPGNECLYPKEFVDPIPEWIIDLVIKPLEIGGIVPSGFVNSAVINDYQPGGCIVSHIDPIHIFDRPIISVSFLGKSALSFGCKFTFKPIRVTTPIYSVQLKRGCVTVLKGFAANNVTHCVRPQDTITRRSVILLRCVLPNAPRIGIQDVDVNKSKQRNKLEIRKRRKNQEDENLSNYCKKPKLLNIPTQKFL